MALWSSIIISLVLFDEFDEFFQVAEKMEFLPTQKKFSAEYSWHTLTLWLRGITCWKSLWFLSSHSWRLFPFIYLLVLSMFFFLRPLKGLLTYLKRFFWDNDKFAFMVSLVIKGWWHRFGCVVYGLELKRPHRWQKCKLTAQNNTFYRFR